ncbi:DUF342 domain-containing protein [Sulfurimonas sp. SAG-AH-194-C21]|nr:flagellar assembly protein A [Sulfurimonas sp. SAG-AH-194-C21]MDF1883022.1 DUF342 domain-containing protein [Sulfurimonas sp. SAG-AH-194-C21]
MIETTSLITTDILKSFSETAKKQGLIKSKLYAQINTITTLIKDADSDFVEVPKNDLHNYKSEDVMCNEDIEFKQEYHIDIKPKDQNYHFHQIFTTIVFNDDKTSVSLLIKKGSRLKYHPGLFNDFLNYIREQMIKSKIMVYLFDTDYKEGIKELVNVIEKIKILTFKEDKKILLSQGFEAIKSVQASTVMHIQEKNDVDLDSNEQINYADRGFLLNCIEGEELFEFLKPQQGKNGRSCTGKIIEEEIINLDAKPTFTVDDNIEIQDSYENIKYLATKSGYLVKNGNQYEVSNSINIGEISFKTTGTIDSDLDTEISINVVKEDPLEDAIEKGMNVKVQNLSITGSIGPSTTVEARTISVTGQTHQESLIKCVNANIKIHKGKITGREVIVDILDGGDIIADTAIIKNAMSGKIRAKTIDIEILGSHVIMEASEYIEIQTIKGEENKFIFESSVGSAFNTNKKDNTKYIKKLRAELNDLIRIFNESTLKLKKNLEPCAKITAYIIKKQKEGVKIPPDVVKKFKLCKVMKVNYQKIKEELAYKKKQYNEEQKNTSLNTKNIQDAQIVLGQVLRGYNYIQYKLDKPNIEIELRTNSDMKGKTFQLKEDDEGILRIVNINF